jgi:hypothetical protein
VKSALSKLLKSPEFQSLTPFQQRAVAVIYGIHGTEAARELLSKYATNNGRKERAYYWHCEECDLYEEQIAADDTEEVQGVTFRKDVVLFRDHCEKRHNGKCPAGTTSKNSPRDSYHLRLARMTLAELKRRLTVGKEFTCVENTYRPELNGQKRVVVKAQTVSIKWTWDGDDDGRGSWTEFPKARDIVSSTDDTITWRMFPSDPWRDHTVTLRVPAD